MANQKPIAGDYPQAHNKREAKVIETCEAYSPAAEANWDSAPTTQDEALDMLATKAPVLSANGTLTSAEILALNATPVELIAAPGAGKAIVVESIQLFLDFGSVGYVAGAGEDLTLEYAGGTDILSIDNDSIVFLTAAADAHLYSKPNIYEVGALLLSFDNEAVQATIASGEVITGDSDIKYEIKYKIVDLLV